MVKMSSILGNNAIVAVTIDAAGNVCNYGE